MQGVPAGLIHEVDALQSAPWYRRDPYLLFFPLGILLAWVGVGHWFLISLGWVTAFQPIAHAMTQVQGFLMAFAVGFLFTMIPRRTGSSPPDSWEVVVCAGALLATTAAAWRQQWHLAQAAWLILAVVLVAFAVRRFASATARRRPPNGFVWIPLALVMGVVGSVLTGVGAAGGAERFWLHNVGQGLVLQGMFIGLVLGVGGLAFPLMTRGQAPADSQGAPSDVASLLLHAGAAAVLFASFFVEASGEFRAAMSLRFAVVLAVLWLSVELWRPPDQPGSNRWVVWGAGWMLPLGLALAALWPAYLRAALHVTYIGGFALLALAVGTQVTLGHTGNREVMIGRPWQVAAIAACMGFAIVARAMMQLDPQRYFVWMGLASGAFLVATGVWMFFLIPKMWAQRS